jgi:pilus assembly protein CpaE
MIAEVAGNHKIAETFRNLAQLMTGRSEAKKSKPSLLSPFIQRFRKKA